MFRYWAKRVSFGLFWGLLVYAILDIMLPIPISPAILLIGLYYLPLMRRVIGVLGRYIVRTDPVIAYCDEEEERPRPPVRYRGARRFGYWLFWLLFFYALFDCAIPFLPVSSFILLIGLFCPPLMRWIAGVLDRYLMEVDPVYALEPA